MPWRGTVDADESGGHATRVCIDWYATPTWPASCQLPRLLPHTALRGRKQLVLSSCRAAATYRYRDPRLGRPPLLLISSAPRKGEATGSGKDEAIMIISAYGT